MTIHLSRLLDNAPVRDAAVTVVLRGTAHPTIAEVDGSYSLQTTDLTLPGAVAVEFQVTQAAGRREPQGHAADRDPARRSPRTRTRRGSSWWWVLNFAVCIGFLWLISRRRKTPKT